MMDLNNTKIAIIGLGYVGLPLAVEFGKKLPTVGFDIRAARIDELKCGVDSTLEVSAEELAAVAPLRQAPLRQAPLRQAQGPNLLAEPVEASLQKASSLRQAQGPNLLAEPVEAGAPPVEASLHFTSALADIADCNVFIVTVPTPIDSAKRPDLTPLIKASEAIGSILKVGDVVVYESTVYPGCTEEVCVPILEKVSGLKFNRDFFAGYSPERINPGDKQHRVNTILKVTSGSTPPIAEFVDGLYRRIITAGTHKASSIKVAEAAKVIENTQRDVNIALINELALIFNKLGIDTLEVLEAAGTKWNFLPFRPGLVGGHCIGVDPYYLTHKAQEVGYHPEVILAGRRINDGMGAFVASQTVRLMAANKINPVGAKVLVLGLAFKENCPDVRNTRVVDIIASLRDYNANVDVFDPWVDADEAEHEYAIRPIATPAPGEYDAIIIAVSHDQFKALGADGIRAFGKPASVIFDVKYVLPRDAVDGRL